MELYIEILSKILEQEEISIQFPNLKINAIDIVKMECYKALQTIKAIIEDDSLSDSECFMKIEEIVCLFEELGSDAS